MRITILLLLLGPHFCFAQTGSEIYLFDLSVKNNQVTVSNPINITNHKGYDNQPSFHPTQPLIYYSSFNDSGRSDIKYYNFKTKNTANLTTTREREYSPVLTPDGKFVSCVIQRDNGAQDLGKYPVGGGEAIVLINNLKVGYYAWIDDTKLLLFVLEDSGRNNLYHYDLTSRQGQVVANNPGRSLARMPGSDLISVPIKLNKEEWPIKTFDKNSRQLSHLTEPLPGREDIAWIKKGMLITSDGNGLFYQDLDAKTGWTQVNYLGSILPLKGITRMAVSADGTKLAVVVAE